MALSRLAPVLLVLAVMVVAQSALAEEPHPIAVQVKASLKDTTKPFTMIVRLQVKPDAGKQFEAAFAKAIKGTRKEKGNIAYQLNQDTSKPTHYLVYERWKNLAALEAHLKTEHITTLLQAVDQLLEGPPEVQVYLPAGE